MRDPLSGADSPAKGLSRARVRTGLFPGFGTNRYGADFVANVSRADQRADCNRGSELARGRHKLRARLKSGPACSVGEPLLAVPDQTAARPGHPPGRTSVTEPNRTEIQI